MELEDVGIVFNVKYLPETVMTDAEYKANRHVGCVAASAEPMFCVAQRH